MVAHNDEGFSAIQLKQLELLIVEVVKREFSNVGLRVDSDTAVFDARRDFEMLRYIRGAMGRTAQRIGWGVILLLIAAIGTIGKLGIDAWLHRA